jgi:hypothetical protein
MVRELPETQIHCATAFMDENLLNLASTERSGIATTPDPHTSMLVISALFMNPAVSAPGHAGARYLPG